MLVRLTFGSKAGEVVDLLPPSALAMLADGRAVLPDVTPVPAVAAPVATERVAFREDRGMPRGKRRAHR